MSDTEAPAAAPVPVVAPGPRFDPNTVLKYAAGGVLLGMLFALVVLGKMSPDAFVPVAIGTLGALGGHAAGSQGKQS
jgi:hypothetical protein